MSHRGAATTALVDDAAAASIQMPAPHAIDVSDIARRDEYALLGTLLARAPDAALLERISRIRSDDTPLGNAHAGLAHAASLARPERIEREYFELFIGVGRGELLPYG